MMYHIMPLGKIIPYLTLAEACNSSCPFETVVTITEYGQTFHWGFEYTSDYERWMNSGTDLDMFIRNGIPAYIPTISTLLDMYQENSMIFG